MNNPDRTREEVSSPMKELSITTTGCPDCPPYLTRRTSWGIVHRLPAPGSVMTAYYSDPPRRAWRESKIQEKKTRKDRETNPSVFASDLFSFAGIVAVLVSLLMGDWLAENGYGWIMILPVFLAVTVIIAHYHIATREPSERNKPDGVIKITPDRYGAMAALLHACLHPDTQEIAEIAAGEHIRRGITAPRGLKDVVDTILEAWGLCETLPKDTARETRTWLLALAHDLPATEEGSALTHSTLIELTHRLREAVAGQERIEAAITTAPASTDLMGELADEANQARLADARATAVREQLEALSARIHSDATIYNAVAGEITSRSTDSGHI